MHACAHTHTDQPLPISNLTVDPKSATAMNISWTYNQAYQNVLTRIEIFDCRGPLVKNTTVPAKVSFIYVDQNLSTNVHEVLLTQNAPFIYNIYTHTATKKSLYPTKSL